jgi:hypothetical protein
VGAQPLSSALIAPRFNKTFEWTTLPSAMDHYMTISTHNCQISYRDFSPFWRRFAQRYFVMDLSVIFANFTVSLLKIKSAIWHFAGKSAV